jgi:hypothetical protein
MSAIVNDRDLILQGAEVRDTGAAARKLLLTMDAPLFHVALDGAGTPGAITFTATLVSIPASPEDIAFSAIPEVPLTGTGATRTLAFADMAAPSVTISATVNYNGVAYSAHQVINKVKDGTPGSPGTPGVGTAGPRGAGQFYASGTGWTDALADVTPPGGKVVGDRVTISGGTFVMTKYWTGSAWVADGTIIDGNLIVTNSITASKINSNGLTIRDNAGNIIFGAATALDWSRVGGVNRPADGATRVTNTNQLTDGAGLGLTASWSNISGVLANLASLNGSEELRNSRVTLGGIGYTGDPAATRNTGPFAVLDGKITAAIAGSYFAANAIDGTYIANLAADKIVAGTLAAGVIYAGTVSASKVTAGTLASLSINSGSGKFQVDGSTGTTYAYDFTCFGGKFNNINSFSGPAISATVVLSTTSPCISATGQNGPGVYGESYSGSGLSGLSGGGGGSSGEVGSYRGYDFYASGSAVNYGPFTGSHDGLVPNGAEFELGDLMVDVDCVAERGWSNTLFTVERSSEPYQRGVRGPVALIIGPLVDHAPAAMIEANWRRSDTNDLDTHMEIMGASYYELADSHTVVAFNAVGEGRIKVCGEGGPIQADDLLVTSSIPGVAMRQADDLVRGYTVAKARVAKCGLIEFADPSEVKAIPCIYLGG